MKPLELLSKLKEMTAGVGRDMFFYYWKHANFPKAGIFSTKHDGDCAGNFLKAIEGTLGEWPDTTIEDGKQIVLEYERNFNSFVKDFKKALARD